MRTLRVVCAIGFLAGAALTGACAADQPDAAEESGAATCHDPESLPTTAQQVEVTLNEWSVSLSRASVPAGTVNLVAHNKGTMIHEMIVLRADSVDQLPHNADGSINEDVVSMADTVGEIAEFEQGATCGRSFELAAGSYIVFCNIAMGDVVHAKRGMVSQLTVV